MNKFEEIKMEKELKTKFREFTVLGTTQGYLALSKIILNKIEEGYTLEQVKTFCENIANEYGKKKIN